MRVGGYGPGPRAKERKARKTSSEMTHLGLVAIMLSVPVRCRQLMHEVHPDLFATSRPMQRQGSDLRVSVILLVILRMCVL